MRVGQKVYWNGRRSVILSINDNRTQAFIKLIDRRKKDDKRNVPMSSLRINPPDDPPPNNSGSPQREPDSCPYCGAIKGSYVPGIECPGCGNISFKEWLKHQL